MKPPEWFELSRRLRRFLMIHYGTIFGYKWSEQGGQWVMIIVKNQEAYKSVCVEE